MSSGNIVSNTAIGPTGIFGTGGIGGDAYGAGISCSQGVVLVTNCSFVGNRAIGGAESSSSPSPSHGGQAYGAAISLVGSTLIVEGTTFVSNTVTGGNARQ